MGRCGTTVNAVQIVDSCSQADGAGDIRGAGFELIRQLIVGCAGTAANKTSVMSFLLEGAHPHDLGMLLDKQGVAVRTGNHCAQPLMDQYGIPGTVRASFSFYNTFAEVDRLFAALDKAKTFLL